MSRLPLVTATLAAVVLTAACGSERGRLPAGDDVLVSVGDSVLTEQAVLARIPPRLTGKDSALMYHRVVEQWIASQLLSQSASDYLPDAAAIERKVEAYRRSLLVSSYMNQAREKVRGASERQVRNYYDRHKAEMLLERPAVKGMLVKVSAGSPGVETLRRAMQQDQPPVPGTWTGVADEDRFEDTWIDWQTVEDRIPYRFYDPVAFLTANQTFEVEAADVVYLLRIDSWLAPGSQMPYEIARPQIVEVLELQEQARAERRMMDALLGRAIDNGTLRTPGYDPAARRRLNR